MTYESDRYRRGLALLAQVGGAGYDEPIKTLREVAPGLARFTVEFEYGDILARPALDLKTRELCTVAALAAMGTAPAQLRYHINGALNVDARREEIVEVLTLVAVYAGFPAALNGITSARAVFQQRADVSIETEIPRQTDASEDRFRRGLATLRRVSGDAGEAVIASLDDIAPDLRQFIVEFSYGDVIGRPELDDRTTELCTVAICTALGTAQPQLAVHVHGALNVGAMPDEVAEVIQQMAVYAGFPAALNGIGVARAVLAERAPRRDAIDDHANANIPVHATAAA